jgi:lipopolysaccharide transport system ATP-binding protein
MTGGFRFDKLRLVPRGHATSPSVSVERLPFAIEVEDATLHYHLGPFVRGSLKSTLLSLFGLREAKPRQQFVEAIRGLTLNIEVGERVALIGHNGSGKSTLLRALAGVYPLQAGRIRTVGLIGTLLDIGLGFEGEATGRENIYYRGMAMGYSRKQLAAVEKEIVEFADLGEFIDLPVRTYSAGMYVRLGFAISTQISPDILLVDEVFGAGDATFAQRAIERMQRIVEEAGIVVIATHDMALVQRVCNRVIWLNRGEVMGDGAPATVIPDYLRFMNEEAES